MQNHKTTKILSLLLAVMMLFSAVPITALAANDFVISGTALTAYNGAGGDIEIPDEVRSINARVFYNKIALTSVYAPFVEEIGNYAFSGCANLTSVTLGHITSLGSGVFSECNKLAEICAPCNCLDSIRTMIGISTVNYVALHNYVSGYCTICRQPKPTVNYTSLNLSIARFEALAEASYTADSWAAAKAAYNTALAAKTSTDQNTIDNAANALNAKINALQTAVAEAAADYTALDAAISDAGSINTASYTASTAAAFTAAYNAANAISRELKESAQATVNKAASDLTAAIAALKVRADVSGLTAAVADGNAVNTTLWTDASRAALTTAVSAGEDLLSNADELSTDDADAILAAAQAIRSKILSPADYSAVDAALAKIPADLSVYTSETVSVLEAAVSAVVPGYATDRQDEVNGFAVVIEDAVKALVQSHVHTFAEEWTKTATAHWHACTAAGCTISNYASCGLAGAAYSAHVGMQDYICDECGYYDEAGEYNSAKAELLGLLYFKVDSAETSDNEKVIVREAISAISATTDMESLDAVWGDYSRRINLQNEKDKTCANLNALVGADASAAVKAIVAKAVAQVEASTDSSNFFAIYEATANAVAAQIEAEENADTSLDAAKVLAKNEIEALADENASATVCALISKGIYDIENAADMNTLNTIVANVKKAVTAQIAAENEAGELDRIKLDAITAIRDGVPEKVSKQLEKAVESAVNAINAAKTVEEVNKAVEEGNKNIQAVIDKENSNNGKGKDKGKSFWQKLMDWFRSIFAMFSSLFGF